MPVKKRDCFGSSQWTVQKGKKKGYFQFWLVGDRTPTKGKNYLASAKLKIKH